MKTKYIHYFSTLILFASSLAACKKQITVGPPVAKLVTSNVFGNDGTATAAQLSIYAQITNNVLYNLHCMTALSSDELRTNSNNQNFKDLYKNSLSAAVEGPGNNLPFWVPFYNYIYQENTILENLQQSPAISVKVKQQLIGEAEFMRAYFYFYLVNLYGDVPLVTSTDYTKNSILGRTSQKQVYEQIVQDLNDAQANLSPNFVDASDITVTVDRLRPTRWAANALLARTYLYMGNGFYDKAEAQATLVINNTSLFQLPVNINTVFKKNSVEAIWQTVQSNSSTNNFFTFEGSSFILITSPSAGTSNSSTISSQLLTAFEAGDSRKANWISSFSSGTSTWFFPFKYKDGLKSTVTTEYTMMLRLAEQYLIRADARVQQGDIAGALADLNVIRKRAGLSNYTGPSDQASVIAAISHERQVELFTEGDRWFNLKRTGTIDAVMGGPTGVTFAKGGTWNSYQQLYPINTTDILKNENLVQNQGY